MNRTIYSLGWISIWAVGLSLLIGGCSLAPQQTRDEHRKLQAAGQVYEPPFERWSMGEMPQPVRWQDALQRAFLVNGDLEAAYYEWKAAMTRIEAASAWPNSNVQVGFEYMFSKENMKSWDRTTLSAGFDPAMTLTLPAKARQAGRVALEEARVAGHRFEAAKFDLQRRVMRAYLDLALAEERIRIQRDEVALLKLLLETAANRVQAGEAQPMLLKLQMEHEFATNQLANQVAEAASMRSMLNGMLARNAQAPLALPPALPVPRLVAADDAQLIALAVDRNPELAGLARRAAGRRDALELARLAYLPDISPTASVTGSISQAVGAMLMLPTNLPAIRARIDEARALLRTAEAQARQARHERAGSFVATLYLMRNAERQSRVLREHILPAAEQILATTRQAYIAGSVGFIDLIDSQRTLLDVKLMMAETLIERERQLADLEALAGVDIETLAHPSMAPTHLTTHTSREQSNHE